MVNNRKSFKVVHLQYHSNSAGKQALRLHHGFMESGIESSVLSLYSDTADTTQIRTLGTKERLISNIDNKLQNYITQKANKQLGLFSYPILGTNISIHPLVAEADIIYVHWVLFGFLNFSGLKKLAKLNKPIVFFMHDMWTITGGCHYSFDCERYATGCGNCPVLNSDKEDDLSSTEFHKKKAFFNQFDNLFFVAPSQWLFDCAKQSLLTRDKPVFLIPNLIDNTVFKPFEKKTAKQILNLPTDDIIIAFGAVSVDSPYKGWNYLQEALEMLKGMRRLDNITVLIFGSGYNKKIADAIPFETKFVGYMKDDYSMALIYNAADIFVAPSLAETFGLVVLEALCCGTAVVGFETGGIPDLINHRVNGYLAKYKDSADLAQGIDYCIKEDIKGKMLPQFEPEETVKKHLELFRHMNLTNSNYAHKYSESTETSK